MTTSFVHVLICLLAAIAVIVGLTTRYRVPAFFALFLSCFVVGLGVGFPVPQVITTIKEGFGNIMKSLGLIIVLGTALGILLEHTGSTRVMAGYILRKVGEKRAPLAMSITGFIVGLPIFCDSGYIVLNGLNNSLARRTGISIVTMSVALATGLYSVHCLIPPHPGAAAAAGLIGADFGRLILWGIVAALPASAAGYAWALYAGRRFSPAVPPPEEAAAEKAEGAPSVARAFLPVVVPILLIAVKSFLVLDAAGNRWLEGLLSLGDPVLALSIGVLLAFNCGRAWTRDRVGHLLQDAAEKAGGILVIIGAGGAFGAILAATRIGEGFSQSLALDALGLLFPFLLTFILKTAQGSSTVAIITAASIVLPLLPALGLNTETGRLLCLLSMGSGSMMISHANDAYFWVISRFSGIGIPTMLKVYTVASVIMGLVSLGMVYLLKAVLA